jgi:hypothetical protein
MVDSFGEMPLCRGNLYFPEEDMFCPYCGVEIKHRARFCSSCGAAVKRSASMRGGGSRSLRLVNRDAAFSKKRALFICAPILLIGVVLFIVLISGSRRASLDMDFTVDATYNFTKIVCRNIDAEYAKVVDPDYDSPGSSSSCIVSKLEIKLPGTVAQNAQIRFHSVNYSDKVSWIEVIIHSENSEPEFDGKMALILGIEETLCGEHYADQFVRSRYDLYKVARDGFDEAYSNNTWLPSGLEVADYWLDDNLHVKITVDCSLMNEWYAHYTIYLDNKANPSR